MLEKKGWAMTSMRHLPRGQLGDPAKQQKKLLPRINQVGVNFRSNLFLGKA